MYVLCARCGGGELMGVYVVVVDSVGCVCLLNCVTICGVCTVCSEKCREWVKF